MKNKTSVISFKVSEETARMMDEELDWCKRPTTPAYARFQAKDGDTVITLYESGKVVFQGRDADLAADFWIATEKMHNKSEAYQGPKYFSYKGKTLWNIRLEKERE